MTRMTELPGERFDRLLKATSEGEMPKSHRESEGPAIAKQSTDLTDKRRKEC